MTSPTPSSMDQAARILSLIFAFCAWSLTAPASASLGLLLLLFLADTPRNWPRLQKEPALWLMLGAALLTSVLAVRAAVLFPQTAGEQWHAISAWCAPLCFIALAWWIRASPGLVWGLMTAAFLGLIFGVLRRTDWSLVPQIIGGLRYHFDYATTGLAFIAAVCLVGLALFRRRITGLTLSGRVRPVLGWTLWTSGLSFVLIILLVTQSRGAALILAATGLGYLALEWLAPHGSHAGGTSRRGWTPMLFAAGLILLAGAFLWSTKYRQQADLDAVVASQTSGHLSYQSSLGARVNLHRISLDVIAERPLLGWGPGTSSTEFVIPEGLVRLDAFDREQAPDFAHLHSVILEILARFGVVGGVFACLVTMVFARAYRRLWQDPRIPPDLRTFLALTGIMTALFCTYDFRLVHTEFRFFAILYLGILYGLFLSSTDTAAADRGRAA